MLLRRAASPTAPARRPAPRRGGRPNLGVTLLLALFPALLLGLLRVPLLEDAEWGLYDVRMRTRNRVLPQPLDNRIMLVGVTEADARQMGGELADRTAYGRLLTQLREAEAALVIFDIFFERELSKDSLLALRLSDVPSILAFKIDENLGHTQPEGEMPAQFAALEQLAESGDALALEETAIHQLRDYRDQLEAYEQKARELGQPLSPQEDLEKARLLAWIRSWRERLMHRWMAVRYGLEAGDEPGQPVRAASLGVLSPPLMPRAAGLGIANLDKTEGNVVRRVPLVFEHQGLLYPSLDVMALLQWYGADWREVKVVWGRHLTIHPKRNADAPIRIPIDERGRYLVNYREGESFLQRRDTVPLLVASGLAPEAAQERGLPEAWKGAAVFVGEMIAGSSATDVEPVPLQPAFPMVAMHANVFDNVLRQDFLRVAGAVERWAVLLALAAVIGLLFWWLPFLRAAGLAGILLLAYCGAAFALFATRGLVLPLAVPLAAGIADLLLLFGYIVGVVERDRRLVRDVFLRSVSPRIGEEILKNYGDEALWGTRRVITVLFVDIRGYTELSETQSADRVLGILDRFYDTVSEIVFRHEGQVNKFLGDAVLALFGALPEEPANHAERALRAAAEVQRAMDRVADDPELREAGIRLATGAGVNTGEAVTGLVGRRRIRIEFTALGDTVNTASRLQGLAGREEIILGDGTMVAIGGPGAAVFEEMRCHATEERGVRVKGKAGELTVWRVRLGECDEEEVAGK